MKIGIIGAMDVEVETLRSRMEGATLETVSGMQFAQGAWRAATRSSRWRAWARSAPPCARRP